MYIEKENLLNEIKNMPYSELDVLASELRSKLIDSISKTGGHLASNLGAVELTIALHRVFDSPKDKIVFDVGHQSYVHKILTGRLAEMETIRTLGGMSGFPKRAESEHDMFDSGHSSDSISAALGYAIARDKKDEDYNCIAVIGDGALTGGVAFEALNYAGSRTTPLIVVVNDNEMSINVNVGGLSKHLHSLRTSKGYAKLKGGVKKLLKNAPCLYSVLARWRDRIKHRIMPETIFEQLGFKYYGPIDGHDIKELCETLEFAKQIKRPVVVHCITKKGKGFAPAEQNPSKFHGIGSFNPETVNAITEIDEKSYSAVFGSTLCKLAENDDKIMAISAAMVDATGLSDFKDLYPDRCLDVGIAEQNAVSMAGGLALNGMRPVVAIYSTFLQRAYDQIVTEICLQNLSVVFAIDRAGVTGKDGETHQGCFDISYLSAMPNMTILAPKDGNELKSMLAYALTLQGPVAIRFPRAEAVNFGTSESGGNFKPQPVYASGLRWKAMCILACGSMVKESLGAAELLSNKGIACDVYNIRTIKPLQTDFLWEILDKYGKIVTVEDGCLAGGFGHEVCGFYASKINAPKIQCLGWPDKFIEHGSIAELRAKYGLDAAGIAEKCEEFFETKA